MHSSIPFLFYSSIHYFANSNRSTLDLLNLSCCLSNIKSNVYSNLPIEAYYDIILIFVFKHPSAFFLKVAFLVEKSWSSSILSRFIYLNIYNITHSQLKFSLNCSNISSSSTHSSLIVGLSAVSHLSLNFVINFIIWFFEYPLWDKFGLWKVLGVIGTEPSDHFSCCCHVHIFDQFGARYTVCLHTQAPCSAEVVWM